MNLPQKFPSTTYLLLIAMLAAIAGGVFGVASPALLLLFVLISGAVVLALKIKKLPFFLE